MFFSHELECLCVHVLSSSASGSWKFSIQTYSSQILDFPVPNKVEAQDMVWQHLYRPPAINSLGSKPLIKVHAESFKKEGLARYDECAGRMVLFCTRSFCICNINKLMVPVFFLITNHICSVTIPLCVLCPCVCMLYTAILSLPVKDYVALHSSKF
jgi:hypothetical protein